jgi:hypothetical protein
VATLDEIYGEKPSQSKQRPVRTGGATLDQVFGANPQAGQGTTNIPETTSEGARGAVQTIVPMLATGGASLATRGLSTAAKFAGEMGAGGLSEAGLQASGVSAQSPEAIGLATAFPGIGRGLVALGGQVARMLPGVQHATKAALVDPMRRLGGDLLPAPDPKALYQQLEASNRSMMLPSFPALAQTVKDLGHNVQNIPWEQLKQQTKGTGLDNLFTQIEQTLQGTPAKIVKRPPSTVSGGAAQFPVKRFDQLGEGVYASTSPDIALSYAQGRGPLDVATRQRAGDETVSRLVIPRETKIFQRSNQPNDALFAELQRNPQFKRVWQSEYLDAPPSNDNLWDAAIEAGLDIQGILRKQGYKGASHANYGGSSDFAIWDQSILRPDGDGITLYRGGRPPVISERRTLPIKGTGLPSQPVQLSPAQAPGMRFEEAQAAIEGFNKVIASTSDDALRGNYKKLKSAILTDLETMPAPAGTPIALWNEAREAYRRQKTRDIFSDAIERYITPREGLDHANPDGLLKWLRNSDEMRARLDPKQFKDLESQVQKMASLTGRERSRVLSMLAGLATTGSAGGALVGYLGAEAMSKAMLTEEGKRVVSKMLLNPSESNVRRLGAILGAGLAGALDEPGPMPMPSMAMPFQER